MMRQEEEEEEMSLASCFGFWQGQVWGGDFKETDLPILARQVQKFTFGELEKITTHDMIEAIQEIVVEECYRLPRTQVRHFVDFANLMGKKLLDLEQDKQTKSFIDGILLGIIRKLTY